MGFDPLAIWDLYVQNVFGSTVLTGLFFLLFVVIVGHRFGWNLATYAAVATPVLYLLSIRFINVNIIPVYLVGLGIILGIAMLILIKR